MRGSRVASQRKTQGTLRLSCASFSALVIPYSGKLSREKTFANFAVLWPFTKVFSAKSGGVASFGAAQASNPRKFSYFSPIRESFLPRKFPAIRYSTDTASETTNTVEHGTMDQQARCGQTLTLQVCMTLPTLHLPCKQGPAVGDARLLYELVVWFCQAFRLLFHTRQTTAGGHISLQGFFDLCFSVQCAILKVAMSG